MTNSQLFGLIVGEVITLVAAVAYIRGQMSLFSTTLKDVADDVKKLSSVQKDIAVLQKDIQRIEARLDKYTNLDNRLTKLETILLRDNYRK